VQRDTARGVQHPASPMPDGEEAGLAEAVVAAPGAGDGEAVGDREEAAAGAIGPRSQDRGAGGMLRRYRRKTWMTIRVREL
jgi:hypothetical protein